MGGKVFRDPAVRSRQGPGVNMRGGRSKPGLGALNWIRRARGSGPSTWESRQLRRTVALCVNEKYISPTRLPLKRLCGLPTARSTRSHAMRSSTGRGDGCSSVGDVEAGRILPAIRETTRILPESDYAIRIGSYQASSSMHSPPTRRCSSFACVAESVQEELVHSRHSRPPNFSVSLQALGVMLGIDLLSRARTSISERLCADPHPGRRPLVAFGGFGLLHTRKTASG